MKKWFVLLLLACSVWAQGPARRAVEPPAQTATEAVKAEAEKPLELSLEERLALLQILPQQGDIVTVRLVEELRRKLALTDKEVAQLELKVEKQDRGALTTWNPEKAKVFPKKSVEIGSTAMGLITDTLRDLSNKKQLTVGLLPLYERFVK